MTSRRKLILATATALSLGAGAQPAAAQVFVDPGSPSAKEYGIPLEDTRRQNSSDNDAPVAQGERTATLFGEGIGDGDGTSSAPSGAETGGTTKSPSSPSSKKQGSGPRESRGGAERVITGAASPVGATIPQGGFDSAATIGALALSVLLLGGVIGSIARRRSSV